jgi:hypothetical protein
MHEVARHHQRAYVVLHMCPTLALKGKLARCPTTAQLPRGLLRNFLGIPSECSCPATAAQHTGMHTKPYSLVNFFGPGR